MREKVRFESWWVPYAEMALIVLCFAAWVFLIYVAVFADAIKEASP